MTAEETTFFERNRSCCGWETIPVCGAEADLKGSVMGKRADNPEKKESVRKFVASEGCVLKTGRKRCMYFMEREMMAWNKKE